MRAIRQLLGFWTASLLTIGAACAKPLTAPANPDLCPEARELLTYLQNIYGKQTLAAINGLKNEGLIESSCGKAPAMTGFDLSGWTSPPWAHNHNMVVQRALNEVKTWHKRGGIVTMQCHWIHPSNPNGSAWIKAHGSKTASEPFDFVDALKPGTATNRQLMRDLKNHANFLEQLTEAHIPVLWRPFHEIDGGWFWWTDKEHPENTAALWRIMFDYFVNERKLNNLIWVYTCAVHCGNGKEDVENLEKRRLYYPGDEYVDLVGIDIYPSEWLDIGQPQTTSYKSSFEMIHQLAPQKMIVLGECEAIPNPDLMDKDQAQWLYALPWWGPGPHHSEEWIKKTYEDERLITLDRLP